MHSRTKKNYIVERLEKSTHLWEDINNKRRQLFYALQA